MRIDSSHILVFLVHPLNSPLGLRLTAKERALRSSDGELENGPVMSQPLHGRPTVYGPAIPRTDRIDAPEALSSEHAEDHFDLERKVTGRVFSR